MLREIGTNDCDGGPNFAYLTYHTGRTKPPTIAFLNVLDGWVDAPEVESSGTPIAIYEVTMRATRGTVVMIIELIRAVRSHFQDKRYGTHKVRRWRVGG